MWFCGFLGKAPYKRLRQPGWCVNASSCDPDVVRRAVNGDSISLKLLLTDSHERLCERIARRIPTRLQSVLDAEDIVQEAHIEVFRSIGKFAIRASDSFDRWITTIALNRLRNAVRRHNAGKRGGRRATHAATFGRVADSTIALLDTLAGPGRTPSKSVARLEALEVMQDALAAIPQHYRRAIQLVHIEGRPVREVAAEMDRSERAIHGLCRRGLDLLRARIGSASRLLHL